MGKLLQAPQAPCCCAEWPVDGSSAAAVKPLKASASAPVSVCRSPPVWGRLALSPQSLPIAGSRPRPCPPLTPDISDHSALQAKERHPSLCHLCQNPSLLHLLPTWYFVCRIPYHTACSCLCGVLLFPFLFLAPEHSPRLHFCPVELPSLFFSSAVERLSSLLSLSFLPNSRLNSELGDDGCTCSLLGSRSIHSRSRRSNTIYTSSPI